jgi:NTE family protein
MQPGAAGAAVRLLIMIGISLLLGCASFPENQPITRVEPRQSTLATSGSESSRDVVVMVAFSGGGTRAAALAYGVLEEMRDTEVELHGEARRLLDEIDLVSGVSGGSFTAAYYGLFGDRLFEDFEERFLRRDVQGALVGRVLFNPLNWLRLGSARFSRSDLAAEYYDEHIFSGGTIGDFARIPGPSILINATDLARGSRFSFIREQFDPICNDLANYSVARAVAASSAVPGLLSPIRLRSYAGSCGYEPPPWVDEALAQKRPSSRRYNSARVTASYLDPRANPSIFLADGGVTDNLAVRSSIDRVVRKGSLDEVLSEAGYEGAHSMLLVVVNAQNEPELDLENTGNFFQSLAFMAGITSGIQIRRFNFETLELVRSSFERWADRISSPERPFGFHMVEVSFSQVHDPERRRLLNNLPTSFVLDDEAVDELRTSAREVLRDSEDFQGFLDALRAENTARGAEW